MSLNTGFLRYEYTGTNSFLSPYFDDKISNIEVKLNGVLVEYNFLDENKTYLEIVNTELNIGDIILINRITNSETRIVDYNNGSILSERDLDLDSNQLFYLIQETKGNIEENDYLDIENFNNNLSKDDFTIQKAFETLDKVIYAKIDNQVLQVDNINSLTEGNYDGETVFVKGYYTENDGGGGLFTYDETKKDINDGGLIINGWVRQYDGFINVKWFGAKGDSITDDTIFIKNALENSIKNTLFIPNGVYKITESLIIPKEIKLIGSKAPKLGVYPLLTDSKINLKRNSKVNLDGSSFLFVGDNNNWDISELDRTDEFGEFTYLIKIEDLQNTVFENISIILDVDVFDEYGELTSIDTDNSSFCDVGLLLKGNSNSIFKDFSIFGYFNKSGCVIGHSELNELENPDYNKFYNVDFMGNYGLSILGSSENGQGISGSNFYSCNFYSKDHHSRVNYEDDSNERGLGCLFIDGNLEFVNSNIQGHYFFGGSIRSYCNTPIVLDNVTSLSFNSVVFEYPSYTSNDGIVKDKNIIGSINTDYVTFNSCRNFNLDYIKNNFSEYVDHYSIIGDSQFNSVIVGGNGDYTKVSKKIIQFTKEPLLSTSGWYFESDSEYLRLKNNNNIVQEFNKNGGEYYDITGTGYSKEIINNEIYITSSFHSIIGTDDLLTINQGKKGQKLILKRNTSDDVFTIPSSTSGNIRVSKDYTFDDSFLVLELFFDGSYWVDFLN